MGRKNEEEIHTGPVCMTKKAIETLCKKNKLYVTPRLNDVLYLHYQGYHKIESLEEYTDVKCLWLECNALTDIQGLENQKLLRCLFLQNNFIKKIENLHHCSQLDTVNLSHNYIKTIENCGSDILPVLNTLNLSHNSLKSASNVEKLIECKAVSVLDLSHNRLDDISIVKILAQMPELRVLVLTGNPIINEIPAYRKTLIVECKKLTYLDSRPVFDKDRACAEAWKRGGYEAERKELENWNKAERKKLRDSVRATLALCRLKKGAETTDDLPSSDDEVVEERDENTENENEIENQSKPFEKHDLIESNDDAINRIDNDISTKCVKIIEMNKLECTEDKAVANNEPIDTADISKCIVEQGELATEILNTTETIKIKQRIEETRSFIDMDDAPTTCLQIVNDADSLKISSKHSIYDFIGDNNLSAGRQFLKKPLIEVINTDDKNEIGDSRLENDSIPKNEVYCDNKNLVNCVEESMKIQGPNLVDVNVNEVEIETHSEQLDQNEMLENLPEKDECRESEEDKEREVKQKNNEKVKEEDKIEEQNADYNSIEPLKHANDSTNNFFSELQKFDFKVSDEVTVTSNSNSFYSKSRASISGVTFYCENLDTLKECEDTD